MYLLHGKPCATVSLSPPRQARLRRPEVWYTDHTWVIRWSACVSRVSGQGAPTRNSGTYGEEAQRRPGAREACNAAKDPRVLGISPRTCQASSTDELISLEDPSPTLIPQSPVDYLRRHLRAGRTESARLPAEKAVVLIEPESLLGTLVWPPD
jgi:hypothetical protein